MNTSEELKIFLGYFLFDSNIITWYNYYSEVTDIYRYKDIDDFKNDMGQFGWEPLSEYKGIGEKLNFRCLKCGRVGQATTNYVRKGYRCKYCKWFPNGMNNWVKEKLGSDYEVVSDTLGCNFTSKSKIGVRHNSKYCNYSITYKSISQIQRGARCRKCFIGSKENPQKAIEDRLYKEQGESFKLIQYIDNSHPITIKCSKGHIFKTSRSCQFKDRHLCKQCWEEEKNRRRTLDKGSLRINNTKNLLLDNYHVVPRKYTNSSDFILWHQCSDTHRHTFKSSNDKIKYASKKGKELCPYCEDKMYLEKYIPNTSDNSSLKFISLSKRSNNEIMTILGHFDSSGNLLHYSNNTITKWRSNNFRCPKCYRNDYTNNTLKQRADKYADRINKIYNNRYTVDVSTYKSRHEHVKVYDTQCGHSWYPVARDLLRHETSCTYCNASNGEQKTMDVLDELKLNYEFQYKAGCKDQQEMPYDVYVPYYDLLIEYQGEQHYHPVKNLFGGKKKFYTRMKHDYMKKVYARNNGYQLLCIPYTVRTYPQIKHYLQEELKQLDKIKIYKDWLDK